MSVQESIYGAGNLAFAHHGDPQAEAGAELPRARELLGQSGELTPEQFRELDRIFRGMSQPDFTDLIDDPRHQVRLRQYEALSWRRHGALVAVPALFLLAGAVLSVALLAV